MARRKMFLVSERLDAELGFTWIYCAELKESIHLVLKKKNAFGFTINKNE
jgi:hypothetical protein